MTESTERSGAKPRLYHAPSSYYSMIARLALAEGSVAYEPVFVDIHVRMSQQRPDYVRLNPNMTVPTQVLADRILDQSRDIAEHALGVSEATLGGEAKAWLDLHYGYPIEQLTFGRLVARNPTARFMVPKLLGRTHRRLLALAAENPDLAAVYDARAEIYAERARLLNPASAMRLSERRRAEALDIMDRMERTLGDGRATMVPPAYGIVDTVLTVFLGRMEFAGLGAEIPKRPALAGYWGAMRARPSFAAADIWTRLCVPSDRRHSGVRQTVTATRLPQSGLRPPREVVRCDPTKGDLIKAPMTFTPTMWSILETARERPHILLRPDQIGPARLLERGGFLKLHQSADWWMLATLTDAGREALTTRNAT